LRQIRVLTIFSRQARQKSMEIYHRPTAREQLLRKKTATDGIATRRSTSNMKGRLHFLVRPKGRVLRAGNRSRASRLPNRKRARSTLPASWPTDGLVAKPLPSLRVYGHIRAISTPTRPRRVYDTQRKAYAPRRQHAQQVLPPAHTLKRRKDFPLRQRLLLLRGHPGRRAGSPSTSRPPPYKSRTAPPPHQGFLGADPLRSPPRHRHRHGDMLLFRTISKTSAARQASPATNATFYASKRMATSKGAPSIRRSCSIHVSRYTGCQFLPSRVTLRTWRQVGRTSPPHPSASD
jgi:hypothetical protein